MVAMRSAFTFQVPDTRPHPSIKEAGLLRGFSTEIKVQTIFLFLPRHRGGYLIHNSHRNNHSQDDGGSCQPSLRSSKSKLLIIVIIPLPSGQSQGRRYSVFSFQSAVSFHRGCSSSRRLVLDYLDGHIVVASRPRQGLGS